MMRWHVKWFSVATIATVSGCIQVEQQQVQDVGGTDTNGEDTGVIGPSCGEFPDCTHLDSPCTRGACIGGGCVATPVDGTCSPHSTCGDVVGYCQGGTCVAQSSICSDSEATGCNRRVCGAGGACSSVPVGDSFCVDNLAFPTGACDGLRMDPLDFCDAEGKCTQTEVVTTDPTDLASRLDQHDWFLVLSSRLSGVSTTRAGRIAFDDDGSVDVSELQSQRLVTMGTIAGTWCSTHEGALSLFLDVPAVGTVRLLGQVAPNSDTLIATSASGFGESVMVAVARGGRATDLDGTYRALRVSTSGLGETTISVGHADIERGVLGGAMTLRQPDGTSHEWTGANETAFEDGSNDMIAASFVVDVGNTSTPAAFKGVVTTKGDTALLVPVASEDTIDDGFLLLVRAATSPPDGITGADTLAWTAGQLYLSPSGVKNWVSAPAALATRRGAINGGLFGSSPSAGDGTEKKSYVRGGGVAIGTDQRFAMSFTVDGIQRRWLGYLNTNNDFGFFVGSDPNAPVPSEDQPVTATQAGFGFVVVHPFPVAR